MWSGGVCDWGDGVGDRDGEMSIITSKEDIYAVCGNGCNYREALLEMNRDDESPVLLDEYGETDVVGVDMFDYLPHAGLVVVQRMFL